MPKSKLHKQPNESNPIKGKEDRYVEEHHEGSFGVTKKEFIALLTKAAQPVSEWNKPAQAKKGTSVVRPSDGYIGKRKSQDKTVSKEDLPND